uniref:Immunoglobulin superfamily DCC subclass member 3 n=1 Tax=Pelusios castaneus TaxID=367368 RepID=A0A8C8VFT6_9SAUR
MAASPPPTGLGHPSELAFLLEPADVIAVRARPLVLHCQVEGEPPISITWHRNGVLLANDSHTAILANGSLRIESFHHRPRSGAATNESSVGDYSCAAQNRDGLLVSRKARVQLATLSKFHMHPASMAVEEGGVARFQCLIQGVPEATITWEHDRRALPPDSHRFTLLPAGILQITGVRQADVGAYRCVASNIANIRYSQEAQLGISGESSKRYKEPMILSGPQNLTITVHQTAILECIATGNPQPIVSWSRLDGRSIGVEGIQVLGTGNLMISDVSVQHAGVYVCAANRPGTRVRRTAQGILMVQAPPEFVQWPQSMVKPLGSSAMFTCVAQGVPEPRLVWLKNGEMLTPGENIKLTHNNSTLMLQRLAPADEAIYQCIAENSAGTNQASARLAVTPAKELPSAPQGVQARALSTTSLQVSWQQPPREVTESIIGYVLHIRRAGGDRELQEAVRKTTFQHVFTGLAPATTYRLHLRAYSPQGASQDSAPVLATTMGSRKCPPTGIAAAPMPRHGAWGGSAGDPKLQGKGVEGWSLAGPEPFLPTSRLLMSYGSFPTEPYTIYELKLQAFNGDGDGNSTVQVVRLEEGAEPRCPCQGEGESSLAGVVVGVHIGSACIIFCLLCLVFGYRPGLSRSRPWAPGALDWHSPGLTWLQALGIMQAPGTFPKAPPPTHPQLTSDLPLQPVLQEGRSAHLEGAPGAGASPAPCHPQSAHPAGQGRGGSHAWGDDRAGYTGEDGGRGPAAWHGAGTLCWAMACGWGRLEMKRWPGQLCQPHPIPVGHRPKKGSRAVATSALGESWTLPCPTDPSLGQGQGDSTRHSRSIDPNLSSSHRPCQAWM